MSPGLYTELFFLDEATALAAGHRPCAECRRADYNRFKAVWTAENPEHGLTTNSRIDLVDAQLHNDRLLPSGEQRTFSAPLSGLPDGVFVRLVERGQAHLWWEQRLYAWTLAGYFERKSSRADEEAVVLTPRSTVNALQAGYKPVIHHSLQSSSMPGRNSLAAPVEED